MTPTISHFILTVRCEDSIGIVAAVGSAPASSDAFITESSHYGDEATGLFLMRTVFRPTGVRFRSAQDFSTVVAPIALRGRDA